MNQSRVRFGAFEYQPDTGRLLGPAGEQRLRPQVSRLLDYLLAHPNEVISRGQLARVVWSDDRVVEYEAGLAALIKELRRALDDSADHPRYLETVPRRGLRWRMPPVSEAPDSDTSAGDNAAPWFRWLLSGGVLLGIVLLGAVLWFGQTPDEPVDGGASGRVARVAVLPFLSIGDADRQQRASLFLADTTIAALAMVSEPSAGAGEVERPPFAVIGRTSINRYPSGDGLLPRLAQDLRADLVVEGSYRREGDHWLVTVSMVKVSDQTILLARTFAVSELTSKEARDHLISFAGEAATLLVECGDRCLANFK